MFWSEFFSYYSKFLLSSARFDKDSKHIRLEHRHFRESDAYECYYIQIDADAMNLDNGNHILFLAFVDGTNS